jgi:CBS domain-containing protein
MEEHLHPSSREATMKTLSTLLSGKGQQVWSVAPSDTVYRAIEVMSDKQIGALPVLDGERLVGMLSERDYARKVILAGRASRECRVEDIMTRKVVCVSPNRSVEECMAIMTDKKIRHLPVVEGERIVGIVSIGDLVKSIIADQQFLIEQLEAYITS